MSQSVGRSVGAKGKQPEARVRRVGVRAVAREAGVSTATVSRVFNRPDLVRPELKRRVREVAERLDYSPDPAARSLASHRSWRVGALLPTIDNSIFAQLVSSLQRRLRERGYGLLLAAYDFDPELELEEARALIDSGIDALVLTGSARKPALYELIRDRQLPYVLNSILDPDHPCVGHDNRACGAAATGHLLDLGHRAIATIDAPASVNDRAALRQEGVRAALAERRLRPAATIERPVSLGGGREGLAEILRTAPETTGIVCGNDVLAVGAILEARARGLRVPEDLSVVGYEDQSVASEMIPALTTLHVPSTLMGLRLADSLVARLEGKPVPRTISMRSRLVVRQSTAAPRKARTLKAAAGAVGMEEAHT